MKTKGYKPKKEFTLRQKLAGSALCLLLYRLLSFVPLPFVNRELIKAAVGANGSLGLLNTLSGGNLGNMSLMALGIGPWITASIVLQLLGLAFPKLGDMQKDEDGKKTYRLITFASAVAMALIESAGLMNGYGKLGYLTTYTWWSILVLSLSMTTGTGILSLMGWYMDERLFGSGTSLILTAGILCSYVGDAATAGMVLTADRSIPAGILLCVLAVVLLLLLFAYTVFISSCEKRIPVVYASAAAKGNMKNMSRIPLKLLVGGVVPVIFASTIITFPALIGSVLGSSARWLELFNTNCWLRGGYTWQNIGFVLYVAMIIAFGYFCQMMYVNPYELAENLKKNGATVPGVRPGKPTAQYIITQAKWLTALGGIFLTVIAAIPMAVSGLTGLSSLSFLGTSILIVVGTIMETWDKWSSMNLSKEYAGKGSLKGIL